MGGVGQEGQQNNNTCATGVLLGVVLYTGGGGRGGEGGEGGKKREGVVHFAWKEEEAWKKTDKKNVGFRKFFLGGRRLYSTRVKFVSLFWELNSNRRKEGFFL